METITLRVFWSCMLACASIFISGIWLEQAAPEVLFKAGATLFIIGTASFLLWAPMMAYRFLKKI